MSTRHFKLPPHITPEAVEDLTNAIANLLDYASILMFLDKCNLQPTSRARWLAAQSAVNVLLAHEIGQEVSDDHD